MKTLILIILLYAFTLNAELIETHYRYIDTNNTQLILGRFHDLECIDKLNIYAFIRDREDGSITSESYKRIYKSEDYGKTWQITSSINLNDDWDLYNRSCASVTKSGNFFIGYSAKKGFISTIKNSKIEKINLEIDLSVEDIIMFDDNIGALLLRNDFFSKQKLLITNDGWQSWQEVDNVYDWENNIYCIQSLNFKNKDTLAFSIFSEGNPNIMFLDVNTLETTNYLITDELFGNSEFISFINDIDIVNDSLIFCAGLLKNGDGNGGYDNIFKSTDGGKTWNKIFSKINETSEGISLGLQRISFFDNKNGIAVGADHSILFTNDGGETWEYQERHPNMESTSEFYVEWSNRTPIFATDIGALYRYEGDFFDFEEEPDLYKLSGRVMTDDSVGVPNVPIVMSIYIPVKTTLDTIYTDNNGYYESPKLLETKILLELPKSNYQRRYIPDYSNIELKGDSTFNINMEKPKNYYSVSGQAFDEDESIPGFFVEIQTDFGDTIIQANMQGQFYIEKIPESNISITHPYGFTSTFIGNQIRPSWHRFKLMNDTTDLIFKINERIKSSIFFVTGTVTLNGQGLPNVKINENFYNIDIYTNEEGRYITPYYNLWLSPRISIDSVINGVTYNVTPKEYEIDFIEISDDAINIDFELSPITSVKTQINSPYIYPNPANESITISGINVGKVEIFNSLGQLLIQSEIQGNSTINTSKLQTGIYLLKIEHGNEVTFEKLIINK